MKEDETDALCYQKLTESRLLREGSALLSPTCTPPNYRLGSSSGPREAISAAANAYGHGRKVAETASYPLAPTSFFQVLGMSGDVAAVVLWY